MGVSSPASVPAISERMNCSSNNAAWARSLMCSSSSTLKAMLRMPANPTSATARDTVLTPPAPAWLKCTVFTMRSTLWVRATSLRISSVRLPRLSLSDVAMRWMRTTESLSAGKSVLWRMRRSRNSSVPCPCAKSGAVSPAFNQAASAVCMARALSNREAGSAAHERSTMLCRPSSLTSAAVRPVPAANIAASNRPAATTSSAAAGGWQPTGANVARSKPVTRARPPSPSKT